MLYRNLKFFIVPLILSSFSLNAQDSDDGGDRDEYDLIDRTWDRADFDPYNFPRNKKNCTHCNREEDQETYPEYSKQEDIGNVPR